ncbi:RNA methyltransferase [bacterium]|nr:RNA methyltransferase [bacterium]
MNPAKAPRSIIKLTGSLKHKKYRQLEGLSTAEGYKLISEALRFRIPVKFALLTQDSIEEYPGLVKGLHEAGIEIFLSAPGEMERISTLKSPPGCMIIYKTGYKPTARDTGLILCLHRISDPGNLGSILRAADWFGVSKVLLSEESAELHNPAVVRGSMGAVFSHPVETDVNIIDIVNRSKSSGWRVITAVTKGGILPHPAQGDTILLMGDEQGNLPPELQKLSDEYISIPKLGKVESLNLSSACSVLLYELTKAAMSAKV